MFQSLLYANTVQIDSSEIRKEFNEWRLLKNFAIPSSDPDHVVQILLFDYAKSQRALSKEHLDNENRSCFDRWETLRA